MLRPARAALAALALAFVATTATALPRLSLPHIERAQPPVDQHPGEWVQAHSDVPPDPAVRFGTLPNGMRYALMHNATPPGQASIRLRFDAGSLMETDAQQGLAHFLEHMAFNGSTHVPEGEMVRILQRLGLAFGADTNASTSFDETVYKLDLPNTHDDTVDASLMLLREAAGELTIDQGAMDRERGVVLSEERTRDSPAYRVLKARLEFLLHGQRLPSRMPIGTVDVISHANRDQIAAFYRNYYRPERAVLVMVGDFDVAAMEAKIRARFSDWHAVGPVGPEPDLGTVQRRGVQTRLMVEPGSPTSLQIAWVTPPDNSLDTRARRRHDLIEQLGLAVLNRRLYTIARAGDPPLIAAAAFAGDQLHTARITTLFVTARPDRWQAALTTAEQEARRAAQFGARQDELDREITELRAAVQLAAAQAATRRTPDLANGLASSVEERQVFNSPADDLASFNDIVRTLTVQQVSAAMAQAFQGNGPLVFMSSPTNIEGGEQAVAQVFAASRQAAVTAPAALATVTWPYESFGTPGTVAETREISDLETTFVRFANGVRLTVRPTRFRDNQILVKVRVGTGLLSLPRDRQNMNWAGSALLEGGLGRISANDLEQVLASRVIGAQYSAEDDAFVLSGATQRDDLDVEMQLLAAYVSDPGWRPEAFQRLLNYGATLQDQYESTDGGVLGRDLSGLMHSGDRRWTFPSRQEMAGETLADLRAQIGPALANGPVEIVIVGDVTVEQATRLAAATFGALPTRQEPTAPTPPPASAVGVAFPAPVAQPVVLTHHGRADQAIGYMAWPAPDFFANPQQARDISILGRVLQLRLLDVLREQEGATYSPSTNNTASFVFSGYGYLSASVEMPPARMDGFFADVQRIAADLRDHEVTADELNRAKNPLLQDLDRARNTNEYWAQHPVWRSGRSSPSRRHPLGGREPDPRHRRRRPPRCPDLPARRPPLAPRGAAGAGNRGSGRALSGSCGRSGNDTLTSNPPAKREGVLPAPAARCPQCSKAATAGENPPARKHGLGGHAHERRRTRGIPGRSAHLAGSQLSAFAEGPVGSRSGVEHDRIGRCGPLEAAHGRQGLGRADLADGLRRRRSHGARRAGAAGGDGPGRRLQPGLHQPWPDHGRPNHPRLRNRRAEAPAHPGDRAWGTHLVPRLLRAWRRVGPRLPANALRGQGRPLAGEWLQDLDLRRPQCRLGRRTGPDRSFRPQAQRHQLHPDRHAPARRGPSSNQDDRRRLPVLRGVLHRRQDPQGRTAG